MQRLVPLRSAYPTYPAYHPPMAVPYDSSGRYGCVAAARAMVGMAAGAAAGCTNAAATTSSACSEGAAAGSATTAAASVQGKTYYLYGNTGLAPSYGANGVCHTVVPTP